MIATVSVLLAGQFAAGAAIDRWGLLGAERVGVGWWKIVGILLLGIGAGLTLTLADVPRASSRYHSREPAHAGLDRPRMVYRLGLDLSRDELTGETIPAMFGAGCASPWSG